MVPSVPAPALPADSSVWDNPSAIGSPGIDISVTCFKPPAGAGLAENLVCSDPNISLGDQTLQLYPCPDRVSNATS